MKFKKSHRVPRTIGLFFAAILWLAPGVLMAYEESADLAPQMDSTKSPESTPESTEDTRADLQVQADSDGSQNTDTTDAAPTTLRMEPRPFINERDPFSLSGVQRQVDSASETGLRFTRQPGGRIPRLILRGIARGSDNTRIGLIEIGSEGVYMVQEGDTVSLRPSAQAGNTVLSIKEIGEITMIVESGTLGEVIIVR